MKMFERFLETRDVRRQRPDVRLARNTIQEGTERIGLAKRLLDHEPPKYALEAAYEALREIIDGILYETGYKSYSHEATVAYLAEIGFSEKEVIDIDGLRRHRNKIKYYGGNATREEAQRAVEIAERSINRILKERGAL